jgi:hypothetical protein
MSTANDERRALEPSTVTSFPLEEQIKQTALASKQEHARLVSEAESLKRKAGSLRHELAQMDKKVKRLHVHADEARHLQNTLEFEALCLAVRRNDPATTELPNATNFPAGYALRLGEALQENTHVSVLDIHVEKLIPSLKDMQPFTHAKVSSFVTPLLGYIRNGRAMRHVSLQSAHPNAKINKALETWFLDAVFGNRDYIRELTCNLCSVTIPPFLKGMQSTQLNKLDIGLGTLSDYSDLERGSIREAFRFGTRLESLSVHTEDPGVAEIVLAGLKDGASWYSCRLAELKLACHTVEGLAYWTAISEFTHAYMRLKHLQLEDCSFVAQEMDTFLTCLEAPCSISKLSLLYCSCHPNAVYSFLQFMETCQQPGLGGAPLNELVVTWNTLGETCSGSAFASIFRMRHVDAAGGYLTIGSSLRSLSVSGIETGCPGFVQTMARNARHIQLQRVKLSDLHATDCRHLATWIAKTSSLQELELDQVGDLHPILASLRRNGTLRTITLPNTKDSRFTMSYRDLAISFSDRNKYIGELLESLTLDESDQVKNATNDDNRSRRGHCYKSLYPTFLQCANQISATRSSTTLSSLLNLSDSIGLL